MSPPDAAGARSAKPELAFGNIKARAARTGFKSRAAPRQIGFVPPNPIGSHAALDGAWNSTLNTCLRLSSVTCMRYPRQSGPSGRQGRLETRIVAPAPCVPETLLQRGQPAQARRHA